MARPVGSLAVRLTADTSEFNRRMQQATRSIRSMGRQMRSAVNTAGKYAAAITAAGAAIATHLVRQSLAAIDRQSKLARQLDTTQASIAGLTRAAELSGIEQSKLEKNIQAYNKRLGEAIDGQGEAKGALDKLGLSARGLAEMPLDEQMALISDRINGLSTSAEKAAVASDLFSRAGLDMINMFEGGGESIRAATMEARAFGLAVDDIDARQVEMANDAMSSISATMRGFFNRVAVKLAPIIRGIAEKFREAAIETQGFQAQLDEAVRVGINGAHFLGNAWRGIQVIIKGLELGFSGFNLLVFEIARGVSQSVNDLVAGAIGQINVLIQAANNVPLVNIPLIDDNRGISQTQQLLNDLAASAREKVDQTKQELQDLLMEPLPTAGLEDWIAAVTAAGRKAAEAVRDEQARVQAEAQSGAGGGESDDEAKARKEALERRLEQIRQAFASERELELEQNMTRLDDLKEMLEQEIITEEEYRKLKRQQEADHQAKMKEIREKGMTDMVLLAERIRARDVQGSAQALATMTSDLARHSRGMFELNKAAALATGVVKAYEAITSAYSYGMATGGPLLAASLAAAAGTFQFAKLDAIRSAQFGGGSSAGPGAGGTAGTPPSQIGAEQGSQQTIMINLTGSESSTFTRAQVRALIEQINEASDDGAQVVVT